MRIEKATSQKRCEGNNVTKCISVIPGPQCFFKIFLIYCFILRLLISTSWDVGIKQAVLFFMLNLDISLKYKIVKEDI